MLKFKMLLVVLFAVIANVNLSYAQQWSAITGNNTLTINGTAVGVGTTTQTKKFEIWDGTTAGKFTFSAPSCTTSYEASQTLDDTGYKLNVGLLSRNYKIALNGTDRFKLLSNENVGIGTNSLSNISTGSQNIGIGQNSLNALITGSYNISMGYNSLYSTSSGSYNTGIGSMTLNSNTIGSYNTALGYSAGMSYPGSTNSVYIGSLSKSQADAQTNQIVIGYNAVGNGSNTVTLGNDNITGTILKGNVGIGGVNPLGALQVRGINDNSWIYFSSNAAGTGTTKYKPRVGWGMAFTWNYSGGDGESIINYTSASGAASRLDFTSYDGTNLTTEMTLKKGNLGIGTITPNAKIESVTGVNAYPATSGATQSGAALRLRGGDNAVLDFGVNNINTWLQATDQTKLGQNYNICLNPNGGNVGIGTGTSAPTTTLDVNGEIRSARIGDVISNLRMVSGEYGCMLRNDGSDTYMLLTKKGEMNGGWNDLRPLRVNNLTGDIYFAFDQFQISQSTGYVIASKKMGIGLTDAATKLAASPADELLTVNGIIHAKEVKVDLTGSLADFVFKPTYKLMPLNQVEQYVNTNSHLPEMPSAAEVSKNGLNMGEMQNKLLQKVEELTLYVIEQQKRIEQLEKNQK